MKKILLLCTLVLTMSFSVNAQNPELKNILSGTTNVFNNTVNKTSGVVDNTLGKATNGISTVYGDGKSVVSTVYSDSKDAVKYLTPKIESAVSELAKGLKVGTKYLWSILVKQQRVWSWCYLIGVIAALLSWLNFYYRFKKGKEDIDDSGDWKTPNTSICLLTLAVAVTLSWFSFQHIVPMMTGFLNPEFGAMQNVIEVAKTLK